MALTTGTVTVNADESVTGSGYALVLYTALLAQVELMSDTPDAEWGGTVEQWTDLAYSTRMKSRQYIASQANIHAGIITYIKDNAEVEMTIPAGAPGAGLQNLPAVLTPGDPTDGPTAPVVIAGALT